MTPRLAEEAEVRVQDIMTLIAQSSHFFDGQHLFAAGLRSVSSPTPQRFNHPLAVAPHTS